MGSTNHSHGPNDYPGLECSCHPADADIDDELPTLDTEPPDSPFSEFLIEQETAGRAAVDPIP